MLTMVYNQETLGAYSSHAFIVDPAVVKLRAVDSQVPNDLAELWKNMARSIIEAIQNGDVSLAKDMIMKYASYGGIDSQTSRRDGTALFFCCSRGYLELAKLLLEKGASVASTDKNRATPLHGAVDNGHLEVVKLLLKHSATIDAQTYRGDTPLHLAAYRGFGEIAQCLVEAGADYRLVNSNSFTAENEALGRGHLELCNYLRSVRNAQQLAESARQTYDSMIQLDPPSFSTLPMHLAGEVLRPNNQQGNTSHHIVDDGVQRRKLTCKNDASIRSKSCDNGRDKLNNISVISLDPPSEASSSSCVTSLRKRVNHRHSSGKSTPMIVVPPTESCQVLCHNSLSAPHPPVFTPFVFCSSNMSVLSPPASANRYVPVSPQNVNSLGVNYSAEMHRRPSTGSTSSCFSDFSGGTGSDGGSLPSCGSDGSGFFGDSRREDIEFQDSNLVRQCTLDFEEDKDLLSLGVRNPPTQKHKRQLSTTSESLEYSDFSDIYDSTLFSLNSIVSGPRSSSVSGPPSSGPNFDVPGVERSRPMTLISEANDTRPRLNRATSENLPFMAMKTRPDFNKSVSAEFRPQFIPLVEKSQACPRYDRIPSNDLSSSFPATDKPSCSMTCVNIPLN